MYNLSPTCQIPGLDKIYEEYFGKTLGLFVEIGAFDGESVSNTSCLADAGWKGFYVEPVTQHYRQCVARHKNNNVRVDNLAIGTDEGLQTIYCSGIVSTMDEVQSKMVSSMGLFGYPQYTTQECHQIRLDKYLENRHIAYNFDLLVVDVEGREEDVFYSFELEKWQPKMMIIELVDDHDYFQDNIQLVESCRNLREYIKDKGYTEVFHDHINTIFVLNDYITRDTNV